MEVTSFFAYILFQWQLCIKPRGRHVNVIQLKMKDVFGGTLCHEKGGATYMCMRPIQVACIHWCFFLNDWLWYKRGSSGTKYQRYPFSSTVILHVCLQSGWRIFIVNVHYRFRVWRVFLSWLKNAGMTNQPLDLLPWELRRRWCP